MWGILAREVYKNGRQNDNKDELKTAIEAAWENIPQATIRSLYDSLPRRFIALQKANTPNNDHHY